MQLVEAPKGSELAKIQRFADVRRTDLSDGQVYFTDDGVNEVIANLGRFSPIGPSRSRRLAAMYNHAALTPIITSGGYSVLPQSVSALSRSLLGERVDQTVLNVYKQLGIEPNMEELIAWSNAINAELMNGSVLNGLIPDDYYEDTNPDKLANLRAVLTANINEILIATAQNGHTELVTQAKDLGVFAAPDLPTAQIAPTFGIYDYDFGDSEVISCLELLFAHGLLAPNPDLTIWTAHSSRNATITDTIAMSGTSPRTIGKYGKMPGHFEAFREAPPYTKEG